MSHADEPCQLLTTTLDLLEKYKADNGSVHDLMMATGIPYHWFATLPRTKNPSVNRVVRLYEYLSGNTLTVGK